jgi:N-acetylmuramoyl-L-alanine amidase
MNIAERNIIDVDRDALVRTAWGEARNQPVEGIAAVVYCILKRASEPAWWGRTDWQICHHAFQFSCWNVNDPNYRQLLALNPDCLEYRRIAGIVDKCLSGQIPDPCVSIGGATHYKVFGTAASWDKAAEGKPSVHIGAHIFFNLGPDA